MTLIGFPSFEFPVSSFFSAPRQKALDYIIGQVPIGRLIEPKEVASFVGDLYRNEALAGDVFFIHGGLRLGSKG